MNLVERRIRKHCFWLNDFFQGGPLWKSFLEVSRIMEFPGETQDIREHHLSNFLQFATRNSPFYKNYHGCGLREFPIVDKLVYRDHYADFRVPVESIPGQKGALHIQKTSGSTGTPFEIPQDTRCRIRRLATIKAANELIGFHSFDPLLHLRSFSHYWGGEESIRYDRKTNILYADNSNLSESRINKIVEKINTYGIKYIRGYTTSIDLITRYAVDNKIELVNHPLFIAGGELLTDGLRNRVVERLGCHIISQYANEESGVFGQTHLDEVSPFYLNLANCFIEVLDLDNDKPVRKGEMGRIVVTDFSNFAFPLIRYDIGDVGTVHDLSGNGQILSLRSLSGRKQDLIYRTDGTMIDFFNSIPKEVYNNPDVIQWQFIQKDKKDYVLSLCVTDVFSFEQNESFLVEKMKKVLGEDACITMKYDRSSLPVLRSGKRKVVVNEYRKY